MIKIRKMLKVIGVVSETGISRYRLDKVIDRGDASTLTGEEKAKIDAAIGDMYKDLQNLLRS